METSQQTLEVGRKLVELCRKGDNLAAVNSLYADEVDSQEAMAMPGMPDHLHGIEAIRRKNREWMQTMEVHSMDVSGPFPLGDRFAVYYKVDATDKTNKKRMKFEEVGLYTVRNGKVVKEEFFYSM